MDLKEYMTVKNNLIENCLEELLTKELEIPIIEESMKYSIFAGGKRLRPILAIMACELFDGSIEEVLPFSCCIELIHTYSLIHDDLPSMDNDDFRRGKPTNHKVFGEGFAVLAGDALLNTAYEIMLEYIYKFNKPEYIKAAYVISKAAGVTGMVGGQYIDLYYENKDITLDELNQMHDKKTGAMIKASLEIGAIIANAKNDDIKRISLYGQLIGRAFQIADDILDIKGSKEKLGKTLGKDAIGDKSTYVSYYGLEKSIEIAQSTINRAKDIISVYGNKAKLLYELADYIVNRDS